MAGLAISLLWWSTAACAAADVDVALHPNASLVYHLECVTGGISCSREETRALLADILGPADADRIAASWASTIGKYAVQAQLRGMQVTEWPDVGPDPGTGIDLRGRIQEVLFSGGSADLVRQKLGVLMSSADVAALFAAVEVALPRFAAWWSRHEGEWTAYAARLEAILREDALPSIRSAKRTFDRADAGPLVVHLVPQPKEGSIRRAFQKGPRSFVEFRPDDDPASRVAVIVHEYVHYLFANAPQELHRQRWEAFTASSEPAAAAAFAVLNEALASAIGNGLFMQSQLGAAAFEAYAARSESFYADDAVDRAAKAALPLVEQYALAGRSIDREFLADYFRRAQAVFADNPADPRVVLGVSQVYYTSDPLERVAIDTGARYAFSSVYHNEWNPGTLAGTVGMRFRSIPVALFAGPDDYEKALEILVPEAVLPVVGSGPASSCKARRASGGWVYLFIVRPGSTSVELPGQVPDCRQIKASPAWADSSPQDFSARLDDAELAVAGEAARALGEIGAAAFPAIREVLATGSAQQRWGATVALYRSTADPAPFLPELTRQLPEKDERLVQATLGVLARLESRAAPALPALEALLANEAPDIRQSALATLAAIGPAALDSVPEMMPLLRDESAAVRLAAADAIRRVRPPAPLSGDEFAAQVAWLEQHVPALMRETGVPGVSIAILQRGEVAWSRGFGVRDSRSGDAVTTETVFEAASMSKPVLALVAMQLVREGRLDLDRPLVAYLGHDYLPGQPEHRRITARMALSHRTGLPNWRAGYAEMGGPLAIEFAPGSEYTYSGEGILFLQRAIEAITGEPLDRLAQESLFAPLGLVRTSFIWSEAIESDLASGHGEDGGFKERTRYRKPNAAYSLYTTPAEYARLMLVLQRPELLGEQALARATVDLMLQRQLRLDDDDETLRPGLARSVATYRALGWGLDVTPEGDIVQHSGSNSSGFKAFGQFNPAKGSGIVIFTNGDGGYRLRAAVIEEVGDL